MTGDGSDGSKPCNCLSTITLDRMDFTCHRCHPLFRICHHSDAKKRHQRDPRDCQTHSSPGIGRHFFSGSNHLMGGSLHRILTVHGHGRGSQERLFCGGQDCERRSVR